MTSGSAEGHGAQHLIGHVQRFGLLSAAAVVDRYTAIIDRATRDGSFPLEPPSSDHRGADGLVDSAAQVAEACLSLLDTTVALIASRATSGSPQPRMERVVLPATSAGARCETSLWVHNPGSAAATHIDLHTTNMISSDGVGIPTASVSHSPERVELVEAGCAREVRLRVDVPADQPAGHYHGLVLISAAPFEPIALHLQVIGRDGGRDDGHQ